MALITTGPTGHIITGDVLDVNKRELERALKDYDKQVYLAWNPTKMKGWGCWELRRRPNEKTAVLAGSYQGANFFEVDYVEIDHIHCLKNWAFLNYSILGWMKENDAFKYNNFADALESKEAEHQERVKSEALAERAYNQKQINSQMRAFRELVLSGTNPAEIARHWDSNTSS